MLFDVAPISSAGGKKNREGLVLGKASINEADVVQAGGIEERTLSVMESSQRRRVDIEQARRFLAWCRQIPQLAPRRPDGQADRWVRQRDGSRVSHPFPRCTPIFLSSRECDPGSASGTEGRDTAYPKVAVLSAGTAAAQGIGGGLRRSEIHEQPGSPCPDCLPKRPVLPLDIRMSSPLPFLLTLGVVLLCIWFWWRSKQ